MPLAMSASDDGVMVEVEEVFLQCPKAFVRSKLWQPTTWTGGECTVETAPFALVATEGADGRGDVGVIPSVTEPFCGDCDRIRITADGTLRTCLFGLDETDLRVVLRGGGTDADLAAAIEGAVGQKWAGHSIGRVDFIRPPRS